MTCFAAKTTNSQSWFELKYDKKKRRLISLPTMQKNEDSEESQKESNRKFSNPIANIAFLHFEWSLITLI